MLVPRFNIAIFHRSGVVLLGALAVWLLDGAGAIDVFDGAAYDACTNGLSVATNEDPHVALVYLDTQTERDPSALSQLVGVVSRAKPAGIALAFVPPAECRDSLSGVKPWLVFPTDYRLDPADLGHGALALEAEDGDDNPCIVAVSGARDGIHRWHASHLDLEDQPVAALETRIAERAGVAGEMPSRFRIFFPGGPGSLPFVEARQLFDDPVSIELLRDRVVLIGSAPTSVHEAVAGPLARGDRRMSPLEFHGHVVNTLLANRPIVDLPAHWRLVLMMATALALPVWHERRRAGTGAWQLIAMWTCTLLVATALLGWAHVWIRPASLLLLQLGSCLLLWERRCVALQRDVQSFGVDVVGCARRHAWPVRFVASANPWEHVAELIDQLLSPNRLVLMRSTPGEMYVREVSALGCTFKDITERRRDYRREPYSTALAEGRPIPVHQTRCLLSPLDDECQYLTPMVFRGELLGFCLVGVSAAVVESDEGFLDELWSVAEQGAEMLHRHTELSKAHGASTYRIDGPTSGVDRILAEMSTSVRQLMGRIIRLEDIFGAATVPSLVFDLYGHVLIANSRMDQLLDAEQVGPMRNASLPLLAELAGEKLETVRGWVRHVARTRSAETHPIELPASGQPYLLTLTPVSAPAVGQLVDDVYPFQLVGVRADLQTTIPWSALDSLSDAPAGESMVKELVGGN